MITPLPKPSKNCYACGSSDWWQRSDGGWNCGRCHPNPNPNPDKEHHTPGVLALRDRVCLGNDKLLGAWLQIRDIEDKEERESQLQRWNKATKKLNELCLSLVGLGYKGCLYYPDRSQSELDCLDRDEVCLVCPVDWEKGRV